MRGESGSVFVESMIAAAIVALALAAMYRAIGDGAMRDHKLNQKQTALLIAQSELSAVGSEIPLSVGTTGGTEGPYAWSVDIEPYNGENDASDAGDLYAVKVSVSPADGGQELVSLDSVAVGPGT
jgi:hypothetical protein